LAGIFILKYLKVAPVSHFYKWQLNVRLVG